MARRKQPSSFSVPRHNGSSALRWFCCIVSPVQLLEGGTPS